MPRLSIQQIVELVGGEYTGPDQTLSAVRSLENAESEDLSFLGNERYRDQAQQSRAGALLVPTHLEGNDPRWIRVDDPYLALARVLETWFATTPRPDGISPHASVAASVTLGTNVAIGAWASVGAGTVIEEGATIREGSFIGPDCVIGKDTLIHPNVTIHHGTRIGRRCVIHSGVVIGGDGFGFATSGDAHHKIPQIGTVRIEDDVEIGAGSTVDRATLGETVIGEGTKIDNLVMIAHNVRIGRHCLLVAQSAIAGSTEIGDFVVLGGQSGVAGHLRIGSRVQVAAQSAVMKSWNGPVILGGSPARPIREQRKLEAHVRRLPELAERLRRIESTTTVAADRSTTRDS